MVVALDFMKGFTGHKNLVNPVILSKYFSKG